MANQLSATSAWDILAEHERRADLVACCGRLLTRVLTTRRPELRPDAEVLGDFEHASLVTALGDFAALLRRGPEEPGERALASALAAGWIAVARPETPESWERLAADAIWLASRTAYDPFPCILHAMGHDADDFWAAVSRCLTGGGSAAASLARGDRALGAVLLKHHVPDRDTETPALVTDDALSSIAVKHKPAPLRLQATWARAPLSTMRTVAYALCGWLFVRALTRLLLVHVLRMKEPAVLEYSAAGVRIETHRELFGQKLSARSYVLIPSGIAAAKRETKHGQAGLYAGLAALLVGSYLGVSWLVDGVRAGSPSLIATALLVFALGVVLNYLLESFLPSRRKTVALSILPRTGEPLCLVDVQERDADDMLLRLRGR
jgi:hypothetical protein